MGDALGLYKTLHARGPMTVGELAAAAGVNERYLREWASHRAARNYLSYDPALVCVPTSLAQEVGAALGAQAGEAKLREVITVKRDAARCYNQINPLPGAPAFH